MSPTSSTTANNAQQATNSTNSTNSTNQQSSTTITTTTTTPSIAPVWGSRSVNVFQKLIQVGEGTFGKVFKARNKETGELVALKRVRMDNEKEGFPITAIREIKILKQLNHPNIVRLLEIVTADDDDADEPNGDGGIYMVFEFMDHDLTGLSESNQYGGGFPLPQIKCYMLQMLEGLFYCLPEHHEILTNRGFLNLDAFSAAAAADASLCVAGFDTVRNTLVYERPLAQVVFPLRARQMVELCTANANETTSIMVTRDHDLFVQQPDHERPFRKVKAGEVLDNNDFDSIRQLGAATAGYNGKNSMSPLVCELYGCLVASGALVADGRIVATLSAANEAWSRSTVAALQLDACDFVSTRGDNSVTLSIRDAEFCSLFGDDCSALAAWVWSLSCESTRAVICGLRRGDGGERATLYAMCAHLRDELVRLCMHAGYAARFERRGETWAVHYSSADANTHPVLRKSSGEVRASAYDGRVWCLTMPSGFIWTRSVEKCADGVVTKASPALLTGNCHRNNVLHRDLKGSNLLINNRGELKVADFGLARPFNDKIGRYTNNVITLWYRPPELLLGETQYGPAVDIWSAGCILAEMLRRRPLFPGRTAVEQLALIYNVCGSPTPESWPGIEKLPWYMMRPKDVQAPRLTQLLSEFTPDTVALVSGLLQLCPGARMTAGKALDSDWFWTAPLPAKPTELPRYHSSHEFTTKKRKQQVQGSNTSFVSATGTGVTTAGAATSGARTKQRVGE